MQALPESFGYLVVHGDMHMEHSRLESLPESFGSQVDGSIDLHKNPCHRS